jgi:hypothetical protein
MKIPEIFGFFKNNIKISGKSAFENGDILYLSQKMVTIGGSIEVPEGSEAYFCIGNLVGDVLPAGKHRIVLDNIPLTIKALKTRYKNNKKILDAIKDKFPADVYIVWGGDFNLEEWMSEKMIIFTESGQRVNRRINCNLKMKVTTPAKLLIALRQELATVETGNAKGLLSLYISEILSRVIYKVKISVEEIAYKPRETEVVFKDMLNANLVEFGVEVLSISNLNMPKEKTSKETVKSIFREDYYAPKKVNQKIKFEKETADNYGVGKDILDLYKIKDEDSESDVYFERVLPSGYGDKTIDADVISHNKTQRISTYLNIDSDFEEFNSYNMDGFNNANGQYSPSNFNNFDEVSATMDNYRGASLDNYRMDTLVKNVNDYNQFENAAEFCTKCGNKFAPDAAFCSKCGNRR